MIRQLIKENTDIIIIGPQLVALGTMAWVENDIMAGEIHASLITANFAIFAK